MKYKINEKKKEKSEEQEDLKNKIEEKLPQLKLIILNLILIVKITTI